MQKIWLRQYPAGTPDEISPDVYPSLIALFEESVARFGVLPAFTQGKTTLSYSDLDRLSRNFAAFMQKKGNIKARDCVAIMLPNCLYIPLALFGALRAGARITNVNPLYTSGELRQQLSDAKAKAIIIDADSLPALLPILPDTEIRIVVTACSGDAAVASVLATSPVADSKQPVDFDTALALGGDLELEPAATAGKDIAFLQYTGGTTGVSKGAALTHRNLIANIIQFSAMMGPKISAGREIVVTALPLHHIFALTINCLTFFCHGGRNVFIRDPRNLAGLIAGLGQWPFSVFTGVNTLFNNLLNHTEFNKLDFSELKICIGGGAAVQESVGRRWHEVTGCRLLQGYGLSETSPLLTITPGDSDTFSGSIGVPVPSTEISIRDETGGEVPVGKVGELCARGPQVMQGYWRNNSASRNAMTHDGYFKTGDIARMDENGCFYIVDRKKDMILVSGFNVFPNEIEEVLSRHEGIFECACIGVTDKHSGEAVKLFVVAKAGVQVTCADIRDYCRQRLAAYKIPRHVEFVDELPKTAVGKILRRELRKRAGH